MLSVEIIVFCEDFYAASFFFSSAGKEGVQAPGGVRRN
jgi:hypothetical protein